MMARLFRSIGKTIKKLINKRYRLLALTALAMSLSACQAIGPSAQLPLVLGEHVSYRVVNVDSAEPVLELPTLVDITTGERLYANLRAATESPVQPSLLTRQWRSVQTVQDRTVNSVPTVPSLPVVLVGAQQTQHFERDPGADKNLSLPSIAVGANAVAPRGHRVPRRIGLSWRRLPVPGQSVYGGQSAGPVAIDARAAIPPAVLARVRDQWRYRLDIEVAVSNSQPLLRWRVLCFTDDTVHEIERGGHWT